MPEIEISKIFTDNLKHLLEIHNMTYKELAGKIGVKASSVSMWMNGNSLPRMGTLDKIADLFNTSVKALVTIDNDDSADRPWISLGDNSLSLHTKNNAEFNLLTNYRSLNTEGRKEARKRVQELTEIPRYTKPNTPELNAAHAIPNATEEDQQHDEDVMDDENF